MFKIVSIVLLLALSAPVHAFDKWTKEDTYRQLVFTGTCILDVAQTKSAVKNGGHELNPIIGTHPSDERLNTLALSGVIIHSTISYMLPRKYRTPFQYISIGNRSGAVARHYGMGIRFTF